MNLAQLFFVSGAVQKAQHQLQKAIKLKLDDAALLEAYFYQLAHTSMAPALVFPAIKAILQTGTRMNWHVEPNIAVVRRDNPLKADLLSELSRALTLGDSSLAIERFQTLWPSADS